MLRSQLSTINTLRSQHATVDWISERVPKVTTLLVANLRSWLA